MPHTYTYLALHIVFGTKERAPLITAEIRDDLFAYMSGIVRETGCKTVIINGMPDHVHLLTSMSPTVAVADMMRVLKTNASRWVHEKWPARHTFGWQEGYGAFSVSRSAMADVESYIANQEEHHRKVSFEEEYIMLLKRHDLYDEGRYFSR
ncbi:MAG: IS200/IS605 family transposase [Chloroflexota bacterium]